MTDNEIINCWKRERELSEYVCSCFVDRVELSLVNETIDLINRKNAEIEALKNSKSEAIKKFAERVVIAFYYEFEECIPSSMAEKIDEIVKEMTEGGK